MEDVYFYLNKIAEEIKGGKKGLFSGSRSVDENKCIEYLNSVINSLPSVVKEAQYIVRDRDMILAEADAEARSIVDLARADAERIIAEGTIVQTAKAEAGALMDKAEKYAHMLETESKKSTDKLFADSEAYLAEILQLVRSCREEMIGGIITKNPYQQDPKPREQREDMRSEIRQEASRTNQRTPQRFSEPTEPRTPQRFSEPTEPRTPQRFAETKRAVSTEDNDRGQGFSPNDYRNTDGYNPMQPYNKNR